MSKAMGYSGGGVACSSVVLGIVINTQPLFCIDLLFFAVCSNISKSNYQSEFLTRLHDNTKIKRTNDKLGGFEVLPGSIVSTSMDVLATPPSI